MPPYGDFLFDPEDCFFEFQRDVFAQISAALRAAATARAAAAEEIPKAKEIAKDIAEILKDGRIEANAAACSSSDASVAVTVIHRPLLAIG